MNEDEVDIEARDVPASSSGGSWLEARCFTGGKKVMPLVIAQKVFVFFHNQVPCIRWEMQGEEIEIIFSWDMAPR